MGKTYVIGDIHGCLETLMELLGKINPDLEHDTLVFLGDYVDRGPDSKGVIDQLLRLRKVFKNIIMLKGNHEEAFLDYLSGADTRFFLSIGGSQTLASYGVADSRQPPRKHDIPPEHLDFLVNLLPYWEDEECIYVHAGLQPGVHLSQQQSQWLLWADGNRFLGQRYDFGKCIVFGHTVQRWPIIREDKMAIDCGAVYGGHLACLILPGRNVVSVKSRKYWPID